jgi:cytochrome c heme-lyase
VKTAASTTQDSSAPTNDPPQASKESYLGAFLSRLSNQREVSSIPRYESASTPTYSPNGEQTVTSSTPTPPANPTTPEPHAANASKTPDETHWVYPSEQQFFLAMMRKHAAKMYSADMPAPNPEDMKTIVPIHNAVNERAWYELMKWEEGQGGEKCGGVRLVSFKGRPKDRTPKAWLNVALG